MMGDSEVAVRLHSIRDQVYETDNTTKRRDYA
jgi:hypothetical protein